MSQTDPNAKKSNVPPIPAQPAAAKPPSGAAPVKPTAVMRLLSFSGLVLTAAWLCLWVLSHLKSSPPVASAAVEEMKPVEDRESATAEPVPEPAVETESAAKVEPSGTEATQAPSAPATGTLLVQSDVEGADVYLNGELVGKTPHQAKELTPGSYDVKVEKAGYKPFQKTVKVAAKKNVVRAALVTTTASLRVDSNVSGAKVFLDGKERGAAPLTIDDLSPGRHELRVSADGYTEHAETLELGAGRRDIKIDLLAPAATLNEAVAVKHRHRLGSCDGVLRATAGSLVYESDDKHAFTVALADVEQIELDGDKLVVRIHGGRRYDFNERNDNSAALASFHAHVQEARGK